jgi:dienelactone hydrolase
MQRETLSLSGRRTDDEERVVFRAEWPARDRAYWSTPKPMASISTHSRARSAWLLIGYVALACDLHGEAQVVEDLGASIKMLDPLYADPSKTRARAAGGLHALAARPEVDAARVGAIGFCFGGTMGLELARSGADIRAIVGFHSGLSTVAPKTDAKAIQARVLVCIGGDDPFIPLGQRVQTSNPRCAVAASIGK